MLTIFEKQFLFWPLPRHAVSDKQVLSRKNDSTHSTLCLRSAEFDSFLCFFFCLPLYHSLSFIFSLFGSFCLSFSINLFLANFVYPYHSVLITLFLSVLFFLFLSFFYSLLFCLFLFLSLFLCSSLSLLFLSLSINPLSILQYFSFS